MGPRYYFDAPDDPAIPPPSGIIPDFQDPYTLKPFHSLTGATAIVATTCFVLARMYTKHFIMKALKWEDWMCALGWAFYVSFIAIEYKVIQENGGRHQWNITYRDYSQQLKYSNYMDILYAPSICLIKLSILGLVLRLFCVRGRSEWFWWIIQALNISNTLFYLAHFFIPLFVCTPRRKIWDPLHTAGTCLDVFNLYIASAAINVASDIAMFFIPLYRIWQLRISRRRRAGVSAVFAVGALAVVSSIVRLIWGFKLRSTTDFSFVKVETVLWCYGELGAGLIVSCCPIMPRLFRHMSSRATTATGRSTGDISARSRERKGTPQYMQRPSLQPRTTSESAIWNGRGSSAVGNYTMSEKGKWTPLADAVEGGRLVPRPHPHPHPQQQQQGRYGLVGVDGVGGLAGGGGGGLKTHFAPCITKTTAWDVEEGPRGSLKRNEW